MKEYNQTTLQNAMDKMPTYAPPKSLWEAIESELESDLMLGQSIENLPQYSPPKAIWANIESGLNDDNLAQKHQKPWVVTRFWSQFAAAAVFILLFGMLIFFRENIFQNEKISLRQEQLDSRISATTQEPENAAFLLVKKFCQEQKIVCQQPDFQLLKSELDELTQAKLEIKNALGNYGNDPNLVAEMVKIERERSKILEQMVNFI
jgi:hypothetical protein